MLGESLNKIRSLKASLDKLANRALSEQAGASTIAQIGGGSAATYCALGRDGCGNTPYCKSRCVGGVLIPIPNPNSPYEGDCQTNLGSGQWAGGPGNWYPCIKDGLGVPPCPIGADPDSCNYGKSIPEFFRHCCSDSEPPCPNCCCCPENSNDPTEYNCDTEPPEACSKWRNTTGDHPSSHGWVLNCDGIMSSAEDLYGVTLPLSITLPDVPQYAGSGLGGGHVVQRQTAQALTSIVVACRNLGVSCAIDPRGNPNARLNYKRLAACLEYRRSQYAVSNSCGHPFGNASSWRGWDADNITNPCKTKWNHACSDITGACCRELSPGGTKRCYGDKTWPDCYEIDGTWHGAGSECDDIVCETEGHHDCDTDDQCPQDEHCEGGECEADCFPNATDCKTNEDCPSPSCLPNEDCPSTFCNNGKCLLDSDCANTLGCPPGQICENCACVDDSDYWEYDALDFGPIPATKQMSSSPVLDTNISKFTPVLDANISEFPPLKKATKITGPFQGLMHDKCDPSTWRLMIQTNVDDQGNPIIPTFDPRSRLCRRGCHKHPLLKDYDCSVHMDKDKDKRHSASAVMSLIKSMRIKK